ncbi:GT2 family glycosyltransferase [Nonomuraea polychroma]|uniref:GT2 family glycosyltransferase n=1 Tax=Nonomuraea polychroma TaxID=46176 RepID=A0A438MLZ9_9ACTN|nr:glycosyltransferase [Nonomuraea polychroma]RVX46659.1 GT2 family glycosyltransferase [Nonomuraea polychroma]
MLAVVIVTYHSSAVIMDCLKSVRVALQGEGPAKVVVADNASGDDTVELVRRTDPEAEVVQMGRNAGFAAGVNAGVAAAPGCDVLVLNPDIRLEPDAIARLRETLATPGTGIAVPELTGEDGALHYSLRRRPTVLRAIGEALLGGHRAGLLAPLGELVVNPGQYAAERTVDWATGAAWLISRACLDVLGPLDERYFLYSEETEYMLRAGDHGFAVRYQPRARAVHLGGEQSTSSTLWALSAANRVRLHRERHGALRGLAMRGAVMLNEGLRALAKGRTAGQRHRAALSAVLALPDWPGQADGPGYVCFSAQDWWYHNRAHSDFQLMRSVAAHRKVLVVNSIGMRMPMPGRSTQVLRRISRKLRSVAKFVRRPMPGFYVMSPLPLPFYGSSLMRRLNAVLVRTQVRVVCRLIGLTEPVIMTTIPTAWDVVRPMRRRSLLFNRSDRHSAFPESDTATIEELEQALLRRADHVLYVSRALMDEERALTGDRAHYLDHGVDIEHFTRTDRLPADLAGIPGPRVGFFGALDDYLVDFDLLERLAAELPDVSLVLIGDADVPMDRLTKYPNVHWLGFRPYDDIPAYGSGFDVAIMPWLDNPWIRHANPIKLKEYLALGLPVVSTDFAELAAYSERVRIAADPAAFVAAVRATLDDGGPQPPEVLRASVLGASWASRAATLMAMAEAPPGAGEGKR